MESLNVIEVDDAPPEVAVVGPSLSVLLISVSGDVEPSLRRLAPLCSTIGAQLVVSSGRKSESDIVRLKSQWPTVEFVASDKACADCDLRAAGMELVRGDMVAIRCCDSVGDLGWLRPFFPHMALRGKAAVAAFGSLGVDSRWDRRKTKVAYAASLPLPGGRDRRRREDAVPGLAAAAAEL